MAEHVEPPGGHSRRGWAVAGITLAVNLGSFAFLVLVARSAGPGTFGALAALTALSLLFEVPANALQVAAGDGARSPWAPLLLDATAWGAAVCALLLGLSPLVRAFLHLGGIGSAMLLAAYAVPVGTTVVPKGVLARQGRLGLLAAGLLAGVAARLAVGVPLVRQGGGVFGAIAGVVIGEVVTALVLLPGLLRSREQASQPGAHLRWGATKLPAAAFTGYWALTAVDIVLARHWLSTAASGAYAAASTAAELALLVPGAIAAIAFPRLVGGEVPHLVAGAEDARPNQRLMFALGSAAAALSGLLAASLVSLFASSLVRGLFGAPYVPSRGVVGLLSFAAAMTGLLTVLLHYHLGRGGRVTALAAWPGVAVAICGAAVWHGSMKDIAVVMVVATAVVCATMLVVAFGHAEAGRGSLAQQADLALLDATLDLTVVVPYYNPGRLLVPTIERLLEVLEASGASYEVIAVSDGSTDGSDALLDAALGLRPQLTNIVLGENQGKGTALRVGLARGRGRYLGFIDADGDLDPVLFESFQTMVRLYQPDIILGSKRHPLSEVEYPPIRRLYSWGYQQLVRAGFRLNIRDTQTGIKLVRRDVLAAVLPRMVEKRFAFDLELFVIARRLGYKRFLEAPIRLRHQFTSTVSWRSVYRSLLDTAAIWYRLRVLHFYDLGQAPATPGGERLRIDPVVLRGGAGAGAGSQAGLSAPRQPAATAAGLPLPGLPGPGGGPGG
jgi:glycosyltransferase involved in cell wall biosynthesis